MRLQITKIFLAVTAALSLAVTPVLAALPCDMPMLAEICVTEVHACCTEMMQDEQGQSHSVPCDGKCVIQKSDSNSSAVLPDSFSLQTQHPITIAYAVALPWDASIVPSSSLHVGFPKKSQAPPGKIYLFHANLRL